MRPNNAFKPKPLRYVKGMAGGACHAFVFTTRFGLTLALAGIMALSQLGASGMNYDSDRIDEAVLALLAAFAFDDRRAWKGFDFEVMNRLYAMGLIDNPVGKAKSVWLTQEGLDRGRQCAERLFGEASASAG